MKCSQAQKMINDHIENLLGHREKQALEEHLKKCDACTKLLLDMKSLVNDAKNLETIEPSESLWLSIIKQLVEKEEKVLAQQKGKGLFFIFFQHPQRFVIAASLFIIVIVLSLLFYHGATNIQEVKNDPEKTELNHFKESEQQNQLATTTEKGVEILRMVYEPGKADKPPRVLQAATPVYPFEAKRDKIEGRVVLRFIVTKEGKVRNASVLESEPAGVFDQSALEAICHWTFTPATKDGEAVDVIVNAPIVFSINDEDKVKKGWLGVTIQSVTPELKEAFKLKNENGALVAETTPGSPADKAGIKRGDVVITFDGKEIREVSDLPFIVTSTEVGKTVSVEVIRNGEKKTLEVRVEELKE